MAPTISTTDLPLRWSSLDKEVGITSDGQSTNGTSTPASQEYYDLPEEKLSVAPDMAAITKAIKERESELHLDQRYMSSEEALSMSPPGEDLELLDDSDDTYDVDELLGDLYDDVTEDEKEVVRQTSRKRTYSEMAVALSITVMGKATIINLNSSASGSDDDSLAELKTRKRDVPFIAVPQRLRPISIIKPIEIRSDGSQSALSPDFWSAVPMFGSIVTPRSNSPSHEHQHTFDSPITNTSSSHSSANSTADSSEFGSVETATSTFSSPHLDDDSNTPSLHETSPSKPTSLFRSLGSKFTTLARKPRNASVSEASNGLAASTMSTGIAGPTFVRSNSIAHRRRGSLNLLGARAISHLANNQEVQNASKPRMQARGASERTPTFELPPFPDDLIQDAKPIDQAKIVSKQLTRRPVGGHVQLTVKEEKEIKRRSLLGLTRRSIEATT